MAEEIREADDVFLGLVVDDREEVAEVVGEDLFAGDAGLFREFLHVVEDVASVDGAAGSGGEDGAAADASFSAVAAEDTAEFSRDQDFPGLALEGDEGAAGGEGFDCNEGEFADPDAGAGDGLHDVVEPGAAFFLRGLEEPVVFLPGQVLLSAAEALPLDLEGHDAAFVPAQNLEKGVEGGEVGVGAGEHVASAQVLLVADHGLFVDRSVLSEPVPEFPDVPQVFADRSRAFLQLDHGVFKKADGLFIDIVFHRYLPGPHKAGP